MARAKAPPVPVGLARLREILSSYRYNAANERDLQDGIAKVLYLRGIPFRREVRLDALAGARTRDIPDFMVGDGIAVEVKVDGSISAVTRQVHRYAQHGKVRAILVVSTLSRHDNLPGTINRKPIAVLPLLGGVR